MSSQLTIAKALYFFLEYVFTREDARVRGRIHPRLKSLIQGGSDYIKQ